jgi:hypothetical protein
MAAEAFVIGARSENVARVRNYVQKHLVAKGMIADSFIHEDDLNNRKRPVLDAGNWPEVLGLGHGDPTKCPVIRLSVRLDMRFLRV